MNIQNSYKISYTQNYLINSQALTKQDIIVNREFYDLNRFFGKYIITASKSKKDIGSDITGEVALWKAVILQALVDISSKSKKKMNRIYRMQSAIWVNVKNKDFLEVCMNADLDPYYVIEAAEEIKKNNPFISK